MTIRRVYIIGPIRAASFHQFQRNLEAARDVALEVWRHGHVPICPHLNSGVFEGALPVEVFLHGDLELLRVCSDAVLVPGWRDSKGSLGEIEQATFLGVTVWQCIDDFKRHRPAGLLSKYLEPDRMPAWGKVS